MTLAFTANRPIFVGRVQSWYIEVFVEFVGIQEVLKRVE